MKNIASIDNADMYMKSHIYIHNVLSYEMIKKTVQIIIPSPAQFTIGNLNLK